MAEQRNNMFDRQVTTRFLETLNRIRYGALTVSLPDGKIRHFQGPEPGAEATLILHDWRVIGSALRRGDIALAETYRDGLWDSPD
ncbi:MAG: class I SAM-dependent methyltransferase, partial [Paracoccaceae bacterium]